MIRLTATELARNLSSVLGRVSNGEHVEVLRNGIPVAVIAPVQARTLSAEAFRDLLRTLPSVDESFATEVAAVRDEIGPPEERWRS